MFYKKLLGLILTFLVSTSMISCLKKSSSSTPTSTVDNKDNFVYLYGYVSKDGTNYICQYSCSNSDNTIEYSECKRFVIEVKSSNLDNDAINVIKEFSEHSDPSLKKIASLNVIKSLVELKLTTPDNKDICTIGEKREKYLLIVDNSLPYSVATSSSLKKQINDTWKEYEYNNKIENTKDTIFYEAEKNRILFKGSSLNYIDASKYCYNRESGLINDVNLLTLVYKDRILNDLNFNEGDCIWVNTKISKNNRCYQTNNMESQNAFEKEEHPFLCYSELFLKSKHIKNQVGAETIGDDGEEYLIK